jgi:hypothetical protein
MGLTSREDTAVVADYIGAVRVLTVALQAGGYGREDMLRLSDDVLEMQSVRFVGVGGACMVMYALDEGALLVAFPGVALTAS